MTRLSSALLVFLLALPALTRAAEDDSKPDSTRAAAEAQTEEVSIPINLWPFIYQEKGPERTETEVLFSLFYYERDHNKLSLALRPFYSRVNDPDNKKKKWSVLWPIARYERDDDVRRLNILPLFWQRLSTPESRSLFIPFYSYNRDEHMRKLGIIGYSPWALFDFRKNYDTGLRTDRYLMVSYSRQGPVTSFSVAPLFNQVNAPEEGSSALFPIYHYSWNKPQGFMHFSMLGLPDHFNVYERWRDDTEHYREWHFLNIYNKQDSTETIHVVAPFYWRFDKPNEDTTQLWPFFGVSRRGNYREYSTVWPFFRYGKDPVGGELNLNLLWPLIAHERRPGRLIHDRFLPLFSVTQRPKGAGSSGWTTAGLLLPLPLYMHSAGDGYTYDRFFWLAWLTRRGTERRDVVLDYYNFDFPEEGVQHRGVFPFWHRSYWPEHKFEFVAPLWGVYKEPDLSFKTFFPLYWDYRTPKTDLQTAIPFYLRYRSGNYTFKSFFPFYYHSEDKDQDIELSYFFPLYGTYRHGDYSKRRLLFFPLWAHLRDEKLQLDSWDLLWPFFHYETSPARGSVRVLPFYWQRRSPEGSFAIGFPLYWQFESTAAAQTHLVPFYGHWRRGDYHIRYYLGPLLVRMEDKGFSRTDLLGSFASWRRLGDDERSHVFPFYWAHSNPEFARHLLLPVGGYERAAPHYRSWFFLGLSKSISLFGYERDPDTDYRLVRALNFYSRRDRHSSFRTFFPLYWASSDGAASDSMLVPLYAWQRDYGEQSWDFSLLGLPEGLSLIEFARNPAQDQASERFLLYYHTRNRDRQLRTLFPLYWAWWEPEDAHSMLFPLYAARSVKDERGLGLLGVTSELSLFNWSRDAKGASSRLFPLYGWRREGPKRELSLFGVWHELSLFYAAKGPEGVEHRFFPLYSYERGGEAGAPGYKVDTRVLWRLFYYSREDQAKDFRFLFRLVRVSSGPERSAFELNPFYFKISRANGASYWAILGGLFGRETRADGSKRFRYLWVF